jgi:LuxR family transcriptional regulator, maltose regulon positive regulatory protein
MRPVPSSKISIPELLPDLVHRTELLRQLDSAADVALVSAPAGYGKTLLVAEWARASTEVDTAWVRLDQDDNDQRRLWSAVLASVARALARSADGPQLTGFDDRSWDMESAGGPDFLAKLIEALSALPRPLRLVLDDLHEVTDTATLHGLQNFLRDRPPNVVLVLVSRLDPPFHLHRLRLEGGLTELRSNRLQFDRVETGTLLRRAGLALTPAGRSAVPADRRLACGAAASRHRGRDGRDHQRRLVPRGLLRRRAFGRGLPGRRGVLQPSRRPHAAPAGDQHLQVPPGGSGGRALRP